MAKEIIFDIKAREALKKGVDALSDAVKITLDPKGAMSLLTKNMGHLRLLKMESPLQKKLN